MRRTETRTTIVTYCDYCGKEIAVTDSCIRRADKQYHDKGIGYSKSCYQQASLKKFQFPEPTFPDATLS